MGKYVSDAAMEALLDYIALSTRMCICSQQPTTYAQAFTTYNITYFTIDPGDFSKADGDTSGRKLIVADQIYAASPDYDSATHIALVGASDLRFVTTCPTVVFTDDYHTGIISVYSFEIEVRDPEG